jgi:hypothetical protein
VQHFFQRSVPALGSHACSAALRARLERVQVLRGAGAWWSGDNDNGGGDDDGGDGNGGNDNGSDDDDVGDNLTSLLRTSSV